ncbi:MAG: Uma2 family endonuclease [Blastocatellales bacterium]
MALPQKVHYYTPEEYLAFERVAKTKHEYLDGQIYAMAGGSPPHNQICFNLSGEIHPQIKGTECIGYTSDQKIRTDPMDLFSYPDLTIVCDKPQFHDKHKDVILNPKVIIEVLSPSTEDHDRSQKLIRYQNIKSLSDYILISQNSPAVEHFVRQKGKRQWLFTIETEMKAEIFIASINCRLKLADIYDRVVFPPVKPPFAVVEKITGASSKKPRRKKAR